MHSNASRTGKKTDQYLIIGGAPKSATTSVFRYLADHPQVCPANRKETYFFAREFDLKKVCKKDETLEAFERYFTHCHSLDAVRVEATPYTLYSQGVAQKIVRLLPNATMLFVLRDPVERFVSDYHFHVQREHPSARGTLEDFIEYQLRIDADVPNHLQMGCYIEYVRPFFNAFEPGKVLIMLFEEFKSNPAAEMRKLCLAMGIDADYYANYRFASHNQTINVRYDWLNRMSRKLELVVASTRARVMHSPEVHRMFENVVSAGKVVYRALNDRGSKSKEPVSAEAYAFLIDYYRSCSQTLSKELGRPMPWKSFRPVRRQSQYEGFQPSITLPFERRRRNQRGGHLHRPGYQGGNHGNGSPLSRGVSCGKPTDDTRY